jgi:hypothetical protein
LFAGEWLFDTHDPAQEKWGFVLVRYAASRNQASPRVKLESAKELSKAYLPGLGSTAVAVFKPNPRLAAAWLAVARARGLSTTRVSHTRLVSLLGEATTIPDTEREAWRWIAEEESESGTWPKPEFFKGSTLAVESSRERVVRLATELAPVEGGELRSFAVAVPSGGELLEGVEQLGDGGSLRRLGELIGASDAVGPRAAEFGYRILLRAAISGSRAARRSIRKRSDVGAEAVSAWLRLGRGSSESTEGYRRKVETVATFGGDPPASDDEAWDRIASSLKARYADEGSANGR